MLEQNDLQAIGTLLDEKFKENNRINNKLLKDEIVAEIGAVTSEAFSAVEARIDRLEVKTDKLTEDVALRPTKNEIFSWADERIVGLELARDRHDYLHINELDKLPPQAEISQVLTERGFKQKTA